MKRLILMFTLFIGAVGAEELQFGETVDKRQVTSISTVMSSPADFVNQTVTVSGTIVGVCAKRGCWVDVASDARFQKLRLKVQDGEMVFPMHTKGRQAIASGPLRAITLDIEEARQHLAALAKRTGQTFDPASVTEPMAIYQLEPVGVTILE